MPKKVLLVDDSATTRLMCRSIIARNTNHAVICAHDGDQALNLISSERPDLVLLDVMMPGMSGLEVCQQLRTQRETSMLPVVMLTFRTGEESVQEGFESGCTAYLKKPVQETELLQTLKRYLGD
jgi:putative two-component system response regulator